MDAKPCSTKEFEEVDIEKKNKRVIIKNFVLEWLKFIRQRLEKRCSDCYETQRENHCHIVADPCRWLSSGRSWGRWCGGGSAVYSSCCAFRCSGRRRSGKGCSKGRGSGINSTTRSRSLNSRNWANSSRYAIILVLTRCLCGQTWRRVTFAHTTNKASPWARVHFRCASMIIDNWDRWRGGSFSIAKTWPSITRYSWCM